MSPIEVAQERLAYARGYREGLAEKDAEVERLRADRDLRATQVEEALSILGMVTDRVDEFTYDEFSSVLEDGPCDDERGDIIPSPLRRERDEALQKSAEKDAEIERLRTEVEQVRRYVDRWKQEAASLREKLAAVAALADEWLGLARVPMPERADTETAEDQGFRRGTWSAIAKASAELRDTLADGDRDD